MNRSKIIRLIEEKISKTKNKKDKEKLRELEEAVKEGKMQKVKRITKELSSEIGGNLVYVIMEGLAFGI